MRQAEAAKKRRQNWTRRGTSLVEVLVVLVILLIGVFAVIRIFPLGFIGLRSAESRTFASRLAQQTMEQLQGENANVPQGVLPSSMNPATLVTTEDPDDLGMYDADKSDNKPPVYNPYFADVNRYRNIVGETVKIPLPTAAGYLSGSLYTVKFGPIFLPQAMGDPNVAHPDTSKYLRVYGPPMRGFPVDAGDANQQRGFVRRPQTYLIDYGDDGGPAQIMFSSRRPTSPARAVPYRDFTITFSYEEGDQVQAAAPFTLRVFDSDDPVWQPIQMGDTAYENIVPGSDVVNREFTRLPAMINATQPTPWDEDDPYEYKLLSRNIEPTDTNVPVYANVGALAFNPAGANYSEPTSGGQRAFVAYIDYSVLDWHILREDREVPSALVSPNGALPLKTTLNFIKQTGDIQPDQTAYQGLYPGTQSSDDIQVFDLQGNSQFIKEDPSRLGRPLVYDNYDPDPALRNANADYWIDRNTRGGTYRNGTIYINPERVPPGSQLRILYKAEGEWAVAVQKAFANYEAALNDAANFNHRPTNYNNFGQGNAAGNPNRAGELDRIYFFQNDLNKSIVATIEYRTADGEVKQTQPMQMTISGVEETAGTNGEKYAYINLAGYMPSDFVSGAWRVVPGTAKGVSLKVRVIWKDNLRAVADDPATPLINESDQSGAWRVQDLDTYVTQGAGA